MFRFFRRRIGLRTAITFFTVMMIVVVGFRLGYRARRQAEFKHWVNSTGGCVSYDFQGDLPIGAFDYLQKPPNVPGFLVDLFGIDFFCDIRNVTCRDCGHKNFSIIKTLSRLKKLDVSGAEDADLRVIGELDHLEVVSIDFLSQEQAKILGELHNLRVAYVKEYEGVDLVPFGNMNHLEQLYIDHSSITQFDFSQLKHCSGLKCLSLDLSQYASVVDCNGLLRYEGLQCLWLGGVDLKNVKAINKLSNLVSVRFSMSETEEPFPSLDHVQHLDLRETLFGEPIQILNCPKLKTLCIDVFQDQPLPKNLSSLSFLDTLVVETDESPLDFQQIQQLKTLNRLFFRDGGFYEKFGSEIQGLTQLEEIVLEGIALLDVSRLVGMKNLRKLTIAESTIENDRSLQDLSKLENLCIESSLIENEESAFSGDLLLPKVKTLKLQGLDTREIQRFLGSNFRSLNYLCLQLEKKLDISIFGNMPNLRIINSWGLVEASKVDMKKKFPRISYSTFGGGQRLKFRPAVRDKHLLKRFDVPPEEFLLPMNSS